MDQDQHETVGEGGRAVRFGILGVCRCKESILSRLGRPDLQMNRGMLAPWIWLMPLQILGNPCRKIRDGQMYRGCICSSEDFFQNLKVKMVIQAMIRASEKCLRNMSTLSLNHYREKLTPALA